MLPLFQGRGIGLSVFMKSAVASVADPMSSRPGLAHDLLGSSNPVSALSQWTDISKAAATDSAFVSFGLRTREYPSRQAPRWPPAATRALPAAAAVNGPRGDRTDRCPESPSADAGQPPSAPPEPCRTTPSRGPFGSFGVLFVSEILGPAIVREKDGNVGTAVAGSNEGIDCLIHFRLVSVDSEDCDVLCHRNTTPPAPKLRQDYWTSTTRYCNCPPRSIWTAIDSPDLKAWSAVLSPARLSTFVPLIV